MRITIKVYEEATDLAHTDYIQKATILKVKSPLDFHEDETGRWYITYLI